MPKNILVTGCAGFIGSHTVDLLLEKKYSVIGVDVMSYAGKMSNISRALKSEYFLFFKEDICNKEAIKNICQKHCVDTIINFAAETHVDNSIKDCNNFLRSNIEGVVSLLEVARDLEIEIIHISTDEVYGPTETKCKEEATLNPKNPYSASKAAAEHFVRSYSNTFKNKFKMIRASNNYGPRQHEEKFTPKIIKNLLEGKLVPVYGDGKQMREWIHVRDTSDAIVFVLEKGAQGETYNVSSGFEQTNLNTVLKISDILGAEPSSCFKYVEDRPGHDRRYLIDSSKIENLGWKASINYSEGIRETIDFYKGEED